MPTHCGRTVETREIAPLIVGESKPMSYWFNWEKAMILWRPGEPLTALWTVSKPIENRLKLSLERALACRKCKMPMSPRAVSELCQNPSDWGPWRSVLSEEQSPQVIVFSGKLSEKVEPLEPVFAPKAGALPGCATPRLIGRIDSKAVPNLVATSNRIEFLFRKQASNGIAEEAAEKPKCRFLASLGMTTSLGFLDGHG